MNAILEASGADYAPGVLLQIVGAKIATTAICRSSGLVGGVYAPSIFMGGCCSAAPSQRSASSCEEHFHGVMACCMLLTHGACSVTGR